MPQVSPRKAHTFDMHIGQIRTKEFDQHTAWGEFTTDSIHEVHWSPSDDEVRLSHEGPTIYQSIGDFSFQLSNGQDVLKFFKKLADPGYTKSIAIKAR